MDVSHTAVVEKKTLDPYATCMACSINYPLEISNCQFCGLSTSKVRKCSQCTQVVSAKHPRCPYCGFQLAPIAPQEPLEAWTNHSANTSRGLTRYQQIRAYGVSAIVFVLVAAIVIKFNGQHPASPKLSPPIASSFVLTDTSLYSDKAMTTPAAQPILTNTPIEITSFQPGSTPETWIQIRSNAIQGYIHLSSIAPPTIISKSNGYPLLRNYITTINDPVVLALTANSLDSFRRSFGDDEQSEELNWLFAEQVRALSQSASLPNDLISRERQEYSQLAATAGPYQTNAKQRLQETEVHKRTGSPAHTVQPRRSH